MIISTCFSLIMESRVQENCPSRFVTEKLEYGAKYSKVVLTIKKLLGSVLSSRVFVDILLVLLLSYIQLHTITQATLEIYHRIKQCRQLYTCIHIVSCGATIK